MQRQQAMMKFIENINSCPEVKFAFSFLQFWFNKEGYLPVVAHLLYDKSVVLLSESKACSIHPFSSQALVFDVNKLFKPETPL